MQPLRLGTQSHANAPYTIHALLPRPPAPHEQVSVLPRAALDAQELVELEHAPLAARPALAALVKDRVARVMDTFLAVARGWRLARQLVPAAASATGRAQRNRHHGVVVLGLGLWWRGFGYGGRGSLWGAAGRRADGGAGRDRRSVRLGRLRVGRGRVIDGGVRAGGAGRDGEELVEGQDARLAAFPAWRAPVSRRCKGGRGGGGGARTPFWPSWNSGGPGW